MDHKDVDTTRYDCLTDVREVSRLRLYLEECKLIPERIVCH